MEEKRQHHHDEDLLQALFKALLEHLLNIDRKLEKIMATEKEILTRVKTLEAVVGSAADTLEREADETQAAVKALRDAIEVGMSQADVDAVMASLDKIDASAARLTGVASTLDATQNPPAPTP